MKFTKKSRYGIEALIDLSINSFNGPVALNSIAERNDISIQYLEQVFASLRRAGIVKSVKGAQGGYVLKEAADQITVAMIINALEGNYHIEDQDVSEDGGSLGMNMAIQTLLIDPVNRHMDAILKNLTLADLKSYYQEYDRGSRDMYYI